MSDNTDTTTAGGDAGTTTKVTATTTGTGYVLGQNENQNDKPAGGDADALTQQLTSERSANQIIKQFARERGLTVTQLVEQFTTAENAQKTEAQRLQDAAKAWERKYGEAARELQAERAERVIRDAAATAGARPDRLPSVYRLVRDEVEFGDDGKPSNVAALIEQAKTDAPEFFQRVNGSGDGGKTGDTTVEVAPGMARLAHAYKEKTARR